MTVRICSVCAEAYDPERDKTCRAPDKSSIQGLCPIESSTDSMKTQLDPNQFSTTSFSGGNKTQLDPKIQQFSAQSPTEFTQNTQSPPNWQPAPNRGTATSLDRDSHLSTQQQTTQQPTEQGYTRIIITKQPEEKKAILGWMVIISGDMIYQDYPVYEGQNLIGSHDSCDIAIPDISRVHASLRCKDEHFFIVDCDSDDGTIVNDERIQQRTELHDNTAITLGKVSLRLKCFPPST